MCTTLASVEITFDEPDFPPKNGYKVEYRPAGSTSAFTVISAPYPKTLPIYLPSVPACVNLECRITFMGDGCEGVPRTFVVSTSTLPTADAGAV